MTTNDKAGPYKTEGSQIVLDENFRIECRTRLYAIDWADRLNAAYARGRSDADAGPRELLKELEWNVLEFDNNGNAINVCPYCSGHPNHESDCKLSAALNSAKG